MPAALNLSSHFAVTESNLPLRREQVTTRLGSYPEQLSAQPVVALVLAALLWRSVPAGQLVPWLGIVLGCWLLDLFVFLRFRRSIDTVADVRRWLFLATLMSLLTGLTWGAAAWLLFMPGQFWEQTLLIMVLNGMAAGGIAMLSTFVPSLLLFTWCIGLALIARIASTPGEAYPMIALMLVAYFAFITRAGFSLNSTVQLAIRRGWERNQLVEALSLEKRHAEEANQAKSRFLATASHDLRQPLQALVLFLDVLDSSLDTPQQTQLMGQINKSVSSLNEMFTQLLDLSRLDSGTVRPELVSFRLAELAGLIYNDFCILAKEKGLTLTVEVPDQLTVLSDSHLLERVLRNLVSNAIRYTRRGSVTLSAHEMDGKVLIQVSDTGIGIPAGELDHIFDEHYQINNRHRDVNLGLGLGLSIVQRTARVLGSTIQVVSTPGTGSTFSLLLPCGNSNLVASNASDTAHPDLPPLQPCLVGLIEDNLGILIATENILRQWGVGVVSGIHSDELLTMLREENRLPDIIVSDYRLPHETGLEAIRRVREFCGKPLPALIITGDTGSQELQELSLSGIPVLHKPVRPEALHRSLQALSTTLPTKPAAATP